ncbi:MAG: Gfo/Idh/MocA family oxidoreductase [Sedimentisphaerales bacterium]|jgi:predicted dehydrogenase|nr:Gfo/Idh/MocA family oxidoreductase [Sedimentisphaerales bacterium]
MRTVRFGIVGCGMMGREFASAAARWLHLPEMTVRPEIVAVCNRTLAAPKIDWFRDNVPTLRQITGDYRELLNNPDVEAVYVAVPHHLHAEVYLAALEADKHLMGEKPFGIDRQANEAIIAGIERHPDLCVRCASQFVFFPAAQRIGRMIEAGAFGKIIEVNVGFLHCSDLNPDKPINWKRVRQFNGDYGCMGDLGPHVCALPFRAGWIPRNVRAVLSNIVPSRPDGRGGVVPCETWDNATLLCEMEATDSGDAFPLTLRAHRISPGQRNNWYVEILGTAASARYSLNNANMLEVLKYQGGAEQQWRRVDMGQETAFRSITQELAQFGLSDTILQMWAAYLYELDAGRPLARFAGCTRPDETVLWHKLFTAALESQTTGRTVPVSR